MARSLAAITGASSGIGEVFARKLAARGYDLLLIARRRDRLEKVCTELARTHSIQAEPMEADLAAPEGLDRVASRLGFEERLQMLVNNAGFGTKGLFWQRPVEEEIHMHHLHVDATARLSHAALAGMARRNEGAIINVASVAGFLRGVGNVSYCATKCWINAFTEGLHLELRATNSKVVVQSLCPGFTYTEFHDAAGLDRGKIPRWMWLTAERVVEDSLAGIEQRKLFVIPGWKYKAIVAVTTKLPIWLRLKLEGGVGKKRD